MSRAPSGTQVICGDATTGLSQAQEMLRLERRQRFAVTGLSLPGAFWIGAVLIIPIIQLVWFSFLDDSGRLSWQNYARMLEPLYRTGLITTLGISSTVTAGTVLLGYPLCYMIHLSAPRWKTVCLALVLLPLWTSTLVRTFSWLVILQRHGIVNSALLQLGVIREPLQLIYNSVGTAIALVHMMLPFLVLPLYSGMKNISPDCMMAAATCGASPTRAFWQVFFPLTVPALAASAGMVFVMCLGFYITPAILGGGRVLMWSMLIESALTINPNRGAASALGVVLVVVTMLILLGLRRISRTVARNVAT